MILAQLRTFTIKRVLNKIGKIEQLEFLEIIKKLQKIVTPPQM